MGEMGGIGKEVEYLKVGDIVSVPFNVACGRCRTCREGETGVCLNVNGDRAGGAYGYVDMGGWIGGQAKFVRVPYADFNRLKSHHTTHAPPHLPPYPCLPHLFPSL